jgi:hypothetical protein
MSHGGNIADHQIHRGKVQLGDSNSARLTGSAASRGPVHLHISRKVEACDTGYYIHYIHNGILHEFLTK